MSKMARDKGKRGEYEVRDILRGIIKANKLDETWDPELVGRNLSQTRGGGFDLGGVPLLAVEVKFHEKPNIKAFWAQAYKQAVIHNETYPDDPLTPVLFWRKSRAQWKVYIPTTFIEGCESLTTCIEMDRQAFTYWWVKRLRKVIAYNSAAQIDLKLKG